MFLLACVINVVAVYSPDAPGPEVGVPHIDKVVHLVLFAVVAWTGRMARVPLGPLMVVLLVHALASELAQTFLPRRSGDWLDFVADAAGIGLGAVLPSVRRPARERSTRTANSGPS